MKKHGVECAELKEGHGIVNDAHAGSWDRQVSLLAEESFNKMKKMDANIYPGDFAENLIISGLDFRDIKLKDRFILNDEVVLEVSRIGKECHDRCSIFEKIGKCIMPEEGVFTKVIKGGTVKTGDSVEKQADE
ncbi:MOSC domain-containing protein [Elusimicrobiota bacterium]